MSELGILDAFGLFELKEPEKLMAFFRAIQAVFGEGECPVILKKLYAGYVGEPDFDLFVMELKKIESRFGTIRVIDLPPYIFKDILNIEEDSVLINIFSAIFCALNGAVECVDILREEGNGYLPLKIGDVSIPNFIVERNKGADDYGLIDGEPFWCKFLPSGTNN